MLPELEFVFKLVIDWIRFAEAKNAALIAVNGTIVWNILKEIENFNEKTNQFIFWYVVGLFSLSCISLVLSLFSFLPQTKIGWIFGRIDSASRNNVVFFGEIRHLTADQYLEQLGKSLGSERSEFSKYEKDLSNQIVVNAKIAYKKFNFFRISLWLLVSGALTFPIGLFLYVLIDPNANAGPKT